MSQNNQSILDVAAIRAQAKKHVDDGAVSSGYQGDREKIIQMLNEALATEWVCVLRYMRHYFTATGIHNESIKAEFLEHAQQEQEHASRIAERIAVESYRQMIAIIGDTDPTTRQMLTEIMAVEEEHADEMSDLLGL